MSARPTQANAIMRRLGGLTVVVTGVVFAALRFWALHGCADCGVPI
jgi:hypothetical protein